MLDGSKDLYRGHISRPRTTGVDWRSNFGTDSNTTRFPSSGPPALSPYRTRSTVGHISDRLPRWTPCTLLQNIGERRPGNRACAPPSRGMGPALIGANERSRGGSHSEGDPACNPTAECHCRALVGRRGQGPERSCRSRCRPCCWKTEWAALLLKGVGRRHSYWRNRASSMQTSCRTVDSSFYPGSPAGLIFQGLVLTADPQKDGTMVGGTGELPLARPSVSEDAFRQWDSILAGKNVDRDMPSLMLAVLLTASMWTRETPESLILMPRIVGIDASRTQRSALTKFPRRPIKTCSRDT